MNTIKRLINLRGRRALITGATGNLGRAIVDTLAELGADLVLVDRENSDFSFLISSITKRWGVEVEHVICNLEDQSQRANLIENLKGDRGGLNILINNAAFVGSSDLQGWAVPFEEQSIEVWRRALELNLTAVFDLCQGLAPLLRVSEGANIINIASIYGLFGPDWSLYEGTEMGNPAAYSASKGGLIQLTRWLSTAIAPQVRVNAISPGGILRGQPEIFIKKYEAKTPLGRMATEDDLRGVVAYLSSDMSKYVTGQNIVVDGGIGVW